MKHDSTTTVWDKYSCSKGWQFQLTKAAKIVALASALMLFFPIITHAQNSITGTIKDKATGDPLAGVHVSVGQQVATTNSQGFYVLKNLKPGTHIVTASLVGYKSEQQPAKIVNESITLNFFLEEDLIFLNEVTVSATRTESRIADIPGRIEMITPEKISLASYQSVDELLTLIPGVHTARSFGLFSYRSSVSMRGVSSKEQGRTLVLLDGIPMNKADGGSVNWNLISTREIERIEVVKGPGSALYGGNAMGGIINVVTQKPTRPL
ncbi:MAG TPA: TonB-dependent receptor, partial [Tenuifilaceae bacterium]|nr:TonB-dependent receptor [Tenuifilaceae bacterium]